MTKDEYLSELRAGLAAFSKDEVDRAVSFYEEMVDDRVEAGVSEEEAVGSLEPPAEAAARIISEMSAVPRAAARLRSPETPRSWSVAFIVAVVIGSPVWIPLALGVIMAVIGCFIGLFGLLVAVWAIAASMLLGAPIGLLYLVAGVKTGSIAGALMGLGCGAAVAGVGVFGIHLAVVASKLLVRAIVWCARAVASPFVRTGVPRWERSSMHPAWNLVHLVAAIMVGVGLVSGLAGWGWAGFDSASVASELSRTTASANEFTNPLGLQLFYAGPEPDYSQS